jgi:hypothetical protein
MAKAGQSGGRGRMAIRIGDLEYKLVTAFEASI